MPTEVRGQSLAGLAAGVEITPSIRLVRELGRGGMGSVWVAEHLRLRTQVVVKFIATEHATDQAILERFEREAALAAQAKSPHVVQVFDHGIATNGVPYIAMELLEGEDLASRLAREPIVPPQTYAGWLTQACRGIGRAHGKGIVHRDIKPENIFLCDNDGEILVKVLDFGIAKASPASGFSNTRTGAVMGTAYYMSPEQTMGLKTVDFRTDLWALGVVSYFSLTGVRPFDAEAIGALVVAITSGPIAPPSTHVPTLGPAIDAWMAKALSRRIEDRFASAKEMAEAFAAAAGTMQAAPSRPSFAQQPPIAATLPLSTPAHAPLSTPSGLPLHMSTMSPAVRPVRAASGPIGTDSAPRIPGTKPMPKWPLAIAGVLLASGLGLGGLAWKSSRAKPEAGGLVAAPASATSPPPRAATPDPPSPEPATTTESPPVVAVVEKDAGAPPPATKQATAHKATTEPKTEPKVAAAVAAAAPPPKPTPTTTSPPKPPENGDPNVLKMKLE